MLLVVENLNGFVISCRIKNKEFNQILLKVYDDIEVLCPSFFCYIKAIGLFVRCEYVNLFAVYTLPVCSE